MPPTARRATAERLLFAVLAAAAALMTAGYLGDAIGLPLRTWPWLAALGAGWWTVRVAAFDDDRAGARGHLTGLALVIAASAGYLCWLAGPSLLPVTDGPDVVHHLQLIHFIQRTSRLPHDPALAPYLLEMMDYTPGAHIVTALAANALRLDGLRVILPIAICFVALKAGAVYLLAARLTPSGPVSALRAAAAPLLLFAPAAYAIGVLFQFFFFAQVVAEAFALGAVLAAAGCAVCPHRGYFVAFAFCAVGVMLSWPVYLAPVTAVFLVMVLRMPGGWRRRSADLAMAFAPVCTIAALHIVGHARAGGILTASGAVTTPSADLFGPAFLVLAAAGIVVALVRREGPAVVVFFGAIVVTAVALAVLGVRGGGRGFYLPFKLVYLAIVPAAILASLALMVAAAVPRRFARASGFAVVIVAALITIPRLPFVRTASPITLPAYAAGHWVRDRVDPGCVDYFTAHWLTGYWLHLDVLGNPRDSDRMRAETFAFRDTAARWIAGGGHPYAIVEDLSTLPRELRPEITVLATFPPFAVITHPSTPCR